MATHRNIDRVCLVFVLLALALTVLLLCVGAPESDTAGSVMGYETRLFEQGRVHTIDIVMDDWDGFLDTCQSEEYAACAVVIDGEAFKNVAIRGKGNSSLSMVSSMDSERYSFKIEFDHYDSGKSYYGLDKLSLNNLIQDATCMKDYLAYTLMGSFGVATPLCSYVYVTVNGEDWGLYLAVEGVEESFLQRNYGTDYGELYKPDSEQLEGNMEMGAEKMDGTEPDAWNAQAGKAGRGGLGSGSAALQYIDDDPESYSYIFESAKTAVTASDQARLIAALQTLSSAEDIESAVDTDAVLRYFVVHNYLVNGDSYTGSLLHNYYLYEKDGLLSMIPWDYNLAFGSFQTTDAASAVNDPIDTPLSSTGSGRPMLDWIFADESYTAQYHQYFAEFLDSADILSRIDQTRALIAPYVEKDPTAFYSYDAFETGVATLRTFCQLREQSVRGQLDGTIPATAAGQAADASALIDVSGLTLSDMGSAQGGRGGANGMGKLFGDFGGRGERLDAEDAFGDNPPTGQPDFGEAPNAAAAPEMPGEDVPFAFGEAPQMDRPGMEADNAPAAPNGMTAASQAPNMGALILLGVCILVLLAGLLIAVKFRRK